MDGILSQALGAGGRVLSSVVRRQPPKRKASVTLKVGTLRRRSSTVIELLLENPRNSLNAVEVQSIVPLLRIHDQSCGEPEFIRLRQRPYNCYPKLPIPLAPGESIRWEAEIHNEDVREQQEEKTREAMQRIWGKPHLEDIEAAEQKAQEFRQQSTVMARFARCLHAIEDTSPRLVLLVSTKQDGEFRSKSFTLSEKTVTERIRCAWAPASPNHGR